MDNKFHSQLPCGWMALPGPWSVLDLDQVLFQLVLDGRDDF